MWVKTYDATITAVPTGQPGGYVPIPPLTIPNLSASQLIFRATSTAAKPTWFKAFTLTQFLDPTGDEFNEVQALRVTVPLNRDFLVQPVPSPSYSLRLEVPWWLSAISIQMWEGESVPQPETDWTQIENSADLVSNQSYQIAGLSLVVLTLPNSSNVGDRLTIQGVGPALWKLQQGDGQQILAGDDATSIGQQGLIEATSPRDSIELVCTVANQQWSVLNSYGNFFVA